MEDKRKEFMKILGNNIKFCREEKGLSQEELANMCGWTTSNARSTISKIESGTNDVPTSKLKIIAEKLGVSVCDLMSSSTYIQKKEETDKMIELTYGKDTLNIVQSFAMLDQADQNLALGIILGAIQQFTSQEKYSMKKESLNA